MRQRSFEIVRTPDLEGSSFLFNNVLVRYVGTCPETGISFYCNNGEGGVVGVRVYPDGRKVAVNPTTDVTDGTKGINRKRKQRYLLFRHAWGNGKAILASRAVYTAWREKPIPAGMTIDHIDGYTTNNYIGNLRCVSNEINSRDGGFLRILRHKGFNPGTSSRQTGWRIALTWQSERQEQRGASLQPDTASAEKGTCIPRWMLLRYYDRMAKIKASITKYRYRRLTRDQLHHSLYDPDFSIPV